MSPYTARVGGVRVKPPGPPKPPKAKKRKRTRRPGWIVWIGRGGSYEPYRCNTAHDVLAMSGGADRAGYDVMITRGEIKW